MASQKIHLITMLTGTSAVLCVAFYFRKNISKQLQIFWEGDMEHSRKKQALKKINECKQLLLEICGELEQTSKDIEDLQHTMAVLEKVEECQLQDSNGKAGDESEDFGLSGGYYHFDSQGNKIPNKWDSYDVDAELEKMEKEEKPTAQHTQGGSSQNQDKVRRLKGKIRKSLGELDSDTARILALLDTEILCQGDDAVRIRRKQVVDLGMSTWDKIEKARKSFLYLVPQ